MPPGALSPLQPVRQRGCLLLVLGSAAPDMVAVGQTCSGTKGKGPETKGKEVVKVNTSEDHQFIQVNRAQAWRPYEASLSCPSPLPWVLSHS